MVGRRTRITKTDYDQAWKVQLETEVTEVRKDSDGYWHSFKETIFYPESGGMLADEGTINNLEVLKLLQKNYHNRIKMVYIDPPYNTGNDSPF